MIYSPDAVTITGGESITGAKLFTNSIRLSTVASSAAITIENATKARLKIQSSTNVGLEMGVNFNLSLAYRDDQLSSGTNRYESISLTGASGSLLGSTCFGPATSVSNLDAGLIALARSASAKVLTARAAAGQTADLFRAEDSTKAALLRITGSGAMVHTQPQTLGSFTVATLPSAATAGQVAYASNGRVGIELSGAGTGCPVYSKGGQWLKFDTNTQVLA